MNIPRISTFERVLAREVTPFIPLSATSTFARYVAEKDSNSTAFLCRETGEWGLGGGLCSRLEVADVWACVRTTSQLLELTASVESVCARGCIALVEPIDVTNAANHAMDLHFVASSLSRGLTDSPYVIDSLSSEDFDPGRMHPEIQELLGSLQGLLSDFGDLSNFFVCRVNDLVVAVADTIVSSCGHTAIQQVFTASEYRNRGIASVLVAHLVNRIILLGGVALYICDADNMASAKTAERAGFSLTARLANVKIVP